MAKRLRNRDRRPKEYAVATATNGVLTSGGRVVGNVGNMNAQGRYIVVKASTGVIAIKANG